jgi:hypothetical protein
MIYQASDKNNLNLNKRLMGTFRQTINNCELFEFGLQTCKFTWNNEIPPMSDWTEFFATKNGICSFLTIT